MKQVLEHEVPNRTPYKDGCAFPALITGIVLLMLSLIPGVAAWRTFREINAPGFQRGMDGFAYSIGEYFGSMFAIIFVIACGIAAALIVFGWRRILRASAARRAASRGDAEA